MRHLNIAKRTAALLVAVATVLFWAPGIAREQEPRLVRTLTHPNEVSSLAFSPDGRYVVAGGMLNSTVSVWEVNTGRRIAELGPELGGVNAVAWSPDGKYIAAGRGFVRLIKDRVAINVWDARTGALVQNLAGPFTAEDGSNDVRSLVFSPDGRRLAAGRGYGAVTIHTVSDGRIEYVLKGHPAMGIGLAWSPDGRILATAGESDARPVLLLDGGAGKPLRYLPGHAEPAVALAWSPNGKFLAAGDRTGTVRIVDATSGQAIRSFVASASRLKSVAYSPNGRYLASASGERAIHLWGAPSGDSIGKLLLPDHAQRAIFSPDGRHLAAAGGHYVWLWAIR